MRLPRRPRPAAPARAVALPLIASLALLPACADASAPTPAGDAPSASAAPGSASPSPTATPASPTATPRDGAPGDARAARARFPYLDTSTEISGLRQPWDVQVVPGEGLLVDERETARLLLHDSSGTRQVDFPDEQVWVSGETGLMGLAVDPDFRSNRRFYTCHGGFTGGAGRDVRVDAWRLSDDGARATRRQVLLSGIDATSGRHGGCRLLIARGGGLFVGTGDAAVGRNPQDLTSLAGKVLRLDRTTGAPSPDNPWARARNRNRRYVYSYGHRNVQGLAQRPGGGIWSAEHGPDVDDEINRLVRGGNYGWDPRPGYDERVPMTDFSLPGKQVASRWRSGRPTLATSGATWVRGARWGAFDGTLAVAALKAGRVVFMKFDRRGRLQWTRTPPAARQYGRLRSITRAPNNDLLVTTANGSEDAVVRLSPYFRD